MGNQALAEDFHYLWVTATDVPNHTAAAEAIITEVRGKIIMMTPLSKIRSKARRESAKDM